ncbi:hypothetical protein RHGRI_019691 [Rhododendron griersonianum]|uniref:Flowering time control protein FY n=1 Tax=Rhododendron griersonianum TaxID=479676 RepID=A0AAV6JIA2_9ERIC|nr:hypothetical protein RHGRI_019691 [Rhododendron griersonianum]
MMYGDPQQQQQQQQQQLHQQQQQHPQQHQQHPQPPPTQHHPQFGEFPRGPQQQQQPPPPPPMMRQLSASSSNMGSVNIVGPPDYHLQQLAPPSHPPYDAQGDSFAAKRIRKSGQRRAVDYTSTVVRYIQIRMFQRDSRDRTVLQPTPAAAIDMLPAVAYSDNPSTSFAAKYVHTSLNKNRCSINRVLWTPSGRRLITGSQSGEFTLWNGQSFNFEMILQAHDQAVRSMVWSYNENWMVTGDDGGSIKYWQTNMNNVKANKSAHKESVRDLSFCRTDLKFCSCSDDNTVKVWDFARCQEERSLSGHGWDVKSVDWHPTKSLLVSGGKDNVVKLWDAKSGRELSSLHGHKNTVLCVKWNENGNWVLTASKDQNIKLYDIRAMKELESFRGHQKDVTEIARLIAAKANTPFLNNERDEILCLLPLQKGWILVYVKGCSNDSLVLAAVEGVTRDANSLAWHPFHEEYFVSGSLDGSIFHWLVGHDTPQVEIPNAHDNSVWDLAWHPIGYILCSGSNDHTTKFWCRNRPGDPARDRFNVGHSQGYGEQNPALAGRMPGNFPGTEPPTTPGPFAPGLTRNEGNIPGVGVAMPFSIPSFDPSAQGEQRPPPLAASMPLGAPPLPPGPRPAHLANQQQPYQQQNPQRHQQHPQQMNSLLLPPTNLPQLQPPSHLSMLSHPHLTHNPAQLAPLGMPSTMPGPMPTSLPMPMPSQLGMPGAMNQMVPPFQQGHYMGMNTMHSGSAPPVGGIANGLPNMQGPSNASGTQMYQSAAWESKCSRHGSIAFKFQSSVWHASAATSRAPTTCPNKVDTTSVY